jgi:uncharacterized protein with HEPN domain
MSPKTRREWRFYIKDMLEYCEKVIFYTDGMNQEAFEASNLTYDATLRNIELIGEAATHIPPEIREEHPDIPWRMIIATRNQLIHGYLGIDNDIVWSIIQTEIPELINQLSRIQ